MADRVSKDWGLCTVDPSFNIKETKVTSGNLTTALMSLKESDITYTFMMNLFGDFDNHILCHPYDTIDVPAGAYVYKDKNDKEVSNKNKFTTTIGMWIFNLYLFRDDGLAPIIGYINEPVTKKVFGKINDKLSYALLEDKITTKQEARFLDKTEWLMPFEDVLSPNQSERMLCCTKAVGKKKAELYKKYKEDIDAGKPEAVERMENELKDFAKEYLGEDAALDTFYCGAAGTFDNQFKNMYLMKGAMPDPDPNAKKEYNVALSCYSDGISAEDYSAIANSLSAGPYARGKKTQSGGYWEKLFVSATQYVVLDDPGTDCGTTHYIAVDLDKSNIDLYMYNFIIEGSKLTELNSDNMDKYIGKRVKMRFSSMCNRKNGKLCNACAGNLYYKIGITNIGVATSQIPSTYKNVCMKSFHDSTVKTTQMDIMKAFGLKD